MGHACSVRIPRLPFRVSDPEQFVACARRDAVVFGSEDQLGGSGVAPRRIAVGGIVIRGIAACGIVVR